MWRRFLFGLLILTFLASCEQTMKDVSNESRNKRMLGARYEIIGQIDAYGIRKHSDAAVRYVTLIPRPGIVGSEVGFKVPIRSGSAITILNIVETNRLPPSERMTLIVRLDGTPLPVQVPVTIDLLGGNEGSDEHLLNPKMYRRIK